jgi:hypothetical protein
MSHEELLAEARRLGIPVDDPVAPPAADHQQPVPTTPTTNPNL